MVTVLIPAPKLIQLTWREKFQRDHFHGKQSCVRSGASAMQVSWGPWAQLPKVKVQSWICRYSYSCQQYCGVVKHIVPEKGSSVDINATWPREPLVLRVQLRYLSSWVSTGLWPSLTPAQWKASLKGTWILISLMTEMGFQQHLTSTLNSFKTGVHSSLVWNTISIWFGTILVMHYAVRNNKKREKKMTQAFWPTSRTLKLEPWMSWFALWRRLSPTLNC